MELVKQIWKDKSKGELNPLAFSELAKKMAEKIAEEGKKTKTNKNSQIRKYYDSIFRLNERAKIPEANFNAILIELNRELALIYYAWGRKKVSKKFVDMMEELIKSVENEKHLNAITNFLECFIAYYKVYGPKD